MDIAKKIGRKLREARKASGHTQKEVADLLGLSYVAYGVFERGRTLISLEYLLQLPRILGKPVTYFLPDSVVSEAERQDLTLDPLLQEVMEAWPELDQAGREFAKCGTIDERAHGRSEGGTTSAAISNGGKGIWGRVALALFPLLIIPPA